MRVRFLRSIASFDFGYHPGDVADVDEVMARAWCASGIVVEEPATPAATPEAAMQAAPAHAMRPRARGRR